MLNNIQHGGRRLVQAGFSLVELMIAMVIGLVVVGAVLSAYLGAGATSRTSRAMSQITEDASVALSVLRSSIGMVGYSLPTAVDGAGKFTKAYPGLGLFGCDGGFTDSSAAIAGLTCSPDAGPDSIAVAFEADTSNSVVRDVAGVDVPLDCLGNTIPPGAGPQYLAYNRYYLNGESQLMCLGPGAPGAQALVDNVVDLQIRYGVGAAAAVNQVGFYADAGNVGALPNNVNWTNTVSVRICVVVASAPGEFVMDTDGVPYRDCEGDEITPAEGDRRMFRAFTTTVVLQNRLGNMR
jgi:type IV pilus assembly protein PilW